MPKTRKRLVMTINENTTNEMYAAWNQAGECQWYGSGDKSKERELNTKHFDMKHILKTDIKETFKSLEAYIQTISKSKDEDEKSEAITAIKNLLKADFIYSAVNEKASGETFEKTAWTEEDCKSHLFDTRPIIEVFLYEQNDLFCKFIKLIKRANNNELFAAVIESMKGTGISVDRIFQWNEKMKRAAINEMKTLLNYGKKFALMPAQEMQEVGKYQRLENKNETDIDIEEAKLGNLAIGIANKILGNDGVEGEIEKQPVRRDSQRLDYQTKFAILKFKMDLYKTVHAEDDAFAKEKTKETHSLLKRIVTNFISIIFTGFALNFWNCYRTGHFFLFNNDPIARDTVRNFDKTVGNNPDQVIVSKP